MLPCRREFDFTLLFEQGILALAPDLLFLALCVLRWYRNRREPKKIRHGASGTWEMAGPSCFTASKLGLQANMALKCRADAFHPTAGTQACSPGFKVFATLCKNKDLSSVRCSRDDQYSDVATAIIL